MNDFLSYVIVWPNQRLIKAGYTATDARWRYFASRAGGVLFSLTGFPTEKLARAHEATTLATLRYVSDRAYATPMACYRGLGVTSGWTEIYFLPVASHQLATLEAWLPQPHLGDVLWAPEDCYAELTRRSAAAARDTREAFAQAIRQAKYARASAREVSA